MGDWSIELCERPLNGRWFAKPFLLTNDSHSFIRVLNDQQHSVLELHGSCDKGEILGAIFNTIAKTITGYSGHFSHLNVVALTSPLLTDIFTAHFPVVSFSEVTAPQNEVLRNVECMVRAAHEINENRLDYFLNLRGSNDDQTCHTVSTELFRRIGIDITQRPIPFTTRGRQTDLEKIDPTLNTIVPDRNAPISDVIKALETRISLMSPDFPKSPYWAHTAQGSLSS